jgi:hypothetical protein
LLEEALKWTWDRMKESTNTPHQLQCPWLAVQAAAKAQEAKQDEEWALRERARQKLMAEVDAIRQEQIRERQARSLAQLEEEMRLKMQIDKVCNW